MNPVDDPTMPTAVRRALVRARFGLYEGMRTREDLERLVSTGALLQMPGIGRATFQAIESWLRGDSSARKPCPTCGGLGTVAGDGVVMRPPRRGS